MCKKYKLVGCLGMVLLLAACGSVTPIPTQTTTSSLRLQDGAVQVQDENKDWVPVGGETTFELSGQVESIDPWMVTGNTFATRESTHIAEGLEVGDQVKVKGILLDDGIWLANSIEPTEEQIDPSLVLVGKVTSVDPWMVHGMTLEVTGETEVNGKIAPGMLVEVEILLTEDGTWEVISLTPLSKFTEIPGCSSVITSVVSVEGSEIQFAGWPAIQLEEDAKVEDENGNETTLSAHQTVLVVICATENEQSLITKIIVLKAGAANNDKVAICHKPNKKGGHTLSIAPAAVPAHLAHGDTLGTCP